jgi:hypothetical protein
MSAIVNGRLRLVWRITLRAFPWRRLHMARQEFLFRCDDGNWLFGSAYVQVDARKWEVFVEGVLSAKLHLIRGEVDVVSRLHELRMYLLEHGRYSLDELDRPPPL